MTLRSLLWWVSEVFSVWEHVGHPGESGVSLRKERHDGRKENLKFLFANKRKLKRRTYVFNLR